MNIAQRLLAFVLILVPIILGEPCDFYKPYVPTSPTCTPTKDDYYLDADPKATPFGGIDVTDAGCRYIYIDKCCDIYPRWNWVLGGCESDMPPAGPSSPFACRADVQNTSSYEFYYVAAYQYDGKAWNLDTTSSVLGNGGLINNLPDFQAIKIDGSNSPHPAGGDWQAKWAPRSAVTGTKGLGPPGYMFVLSAKKVQWMTFYALAQKTINRGPEGQFAPGYDNCWYAELDFLEAPFWASNNGERNCMLSKHPHASFFSTGAQYGGCFPVGTNMGPEFASECYTEWCCEGTRCSEGFKPFINPSSYGTSEAGCTTAGSAPPGTTFCGPKGNPQQCPLFSALGGCDSTSFFDNDPNTEYIFAFVVDAKGVYGYRWIANTEQQANAIWPGITKYKPSPTLTATRPSTRPKQASTPCLSTDDYCIIFHPGAQGNRPCVIAGGAVNYLDYMGVATAGGHNWWDLFQDSGQWWDYDSSVLGQIYTNQ